MHIISTRQLLSGYELSTVRSKRTERGDLLTFFSEKMNMSIKRTAHALSVYNVDMLYFLKDKCEKSSSFGKCFNWHVFPKKVRRGIYL